MIATVTLNPSLDRTITVQGLRIDGSNRWTSLRHYAGGKGIDVARAIHEMGEQTIAYGFIGGHAGRDVEILLDEEGVPFSLTPIEQETRTNFIISDTRAAQQTIINAPGPHISKKELERFYKKLKEIPPPDLVVASGSVPPGVPVDIYSTIILGARENNVRTILDSAGQWLAEGVKTNPYLIKPNVREAEELLQRELPNEEAVVEAALNLVGMGIEVAVISRGKDGIIAATQKEIVKAVSPPLKVKSAVGAGDCTVAGLALKLAEGEPLVEACRLAAAMGAATVLTPGTELCHRHDVEELLPQIELYKVPTKQWARTFVPCR